MASAHDLPRAGRPADADASQTIVGSVSSVAFANPQSGFVVLKLDLEPGYADPEALIDFGRATAVGLGFEPPIGARLRLDGRWTTHRSHGRRFEFERCEMLMPSTAEGATRYLASGAFPGVGEVLAARIVERLGSNALEAIRSDPDALRGIAGLRRATRESLAAAVRDRFEQHERQSFLRGLGLSTAQALAIERAHAERSTELVQRDPYALAGSIEGIGFLTADRIALRLGLAVDSLERCRAALTHVLREGASDGHTYLPRARLIEETRAAIGDVPAEALEGALRDLETSRAIVRERDGDDAVYLAHLWADESALSGSIVRILRQGERRAIAGADELASAERSSGLELNHDQREAVLGLLREPIALLTGGPGVGKTTIVRLVVELAASRGARIALASPTGRAARRLSEASGRPASTLHRLLAFDPRTGRFGYGRDQPLPFDLVIVDELSMLDVALAAKLALAVEPPTRLLLVGDPDQLPSVGPGQVLGDLIASGRLPVFRLTRIYRQRRGGLIIENAHRILHGEMPVAPARGDLSSDFYLFPVDDPNECAELVVDVVTERIPRQFGLDWLRDVQVLSPMYRGACGVDALNERLRAKVDPGSATGLFGEIEQREARFRAGDRVIQTRNDYDKEVFNGDMGRVVRLAEQGGLFVAFPDREVFYAADERGELSLAFAITVHRAQGSEYPAVVLPLVGQHAVMLRRNLVYTAVTRARSLLVLVGSRRALALAVDDARGDPRLSRLGERLRGA